MAGNATAADTRMMGIVHAALRRDLERTREALTTAPYPGQRRREALGAHAVWLMDLLRAHHTGEDEGLWPLVRDRDPAAGPLLDALEAEHERITPAAQGLTAAAQRYGDRSGRTGGAGTGAGGARDARGGAEGGEGSQGGAGGAGGERAEGNSTSDRDDDAARTEFLAALDRLIAVLVPHLDREVEEAMPVVAACLTQADWHAWDHRHNIRPKSFVQLGIEGHWLLDDLDPEGRRLVVGLVPPVPRFILLRGFARAYRRRADACWQPEGSPAARGRNGR